MPFKQRLLRRQFTPIGQSRRPNLLVSGCSYTWNNHEDCAVTWPYYLRDLVGFDQVFDCSQPGSGYNHTHTAVITELETNKIITPESTLIIIMWSGNERIDVTADRELVESWTNMEPPDLGYGLSTLGLGQQRPTWPNRYGTEPNPDVEKLRSQYRRLISSNSQVLESAVRLISLAGYLDSRGFDYIFLDWDDTRPSTRLPGMDPWAQGRFDDIETLGSWSTRHHQRMRDGHPTPDAHLSWTREVLVPYLIQKDRVRLGPA